MKQTELFESGKEIQEKGCMQTGNMSRAHAHARIVFYLRDELLERFGSRLVDSERVVGIPGGMSERCKRQVKVAGNFKSKETSGNARSLT